MFKYSNFINHDNNDARWKEQGNVSGQTENWLNWTPANIDYYFNTNSGRNYNEVNSWFTTEGFGTTPNNDYNPGQTALYSTRKVNTTDGFGANKLNNYNYQEVALKPDTTYTISAWIQEDKTLLMLIVITILFILLFGKGPVEQEIPLSILKGLFLPVITVLG